MGLHTKRLNCDPNQDLRGKIDFSLQGLICKLIYTLVFSAIMITMLKGPIFFLGHLCVHTGKLIVNVIAKPKTTYNH